MNFNHLSRKGLLALLSASSMALLSGCASCQQVSTTQNSLAQSSVRVMPQQNTTSTNFNNSPQKKAYSPVLTTNSHSKISKHVQYDTGWNLKGNCLGETSNSQMQYELEQFAKGTNSFWVATNAFRKAGELPFVLYHTTNTFLVRNDDNRTLSPEAQYLYVSRFVTNNMGKVATEAELMKTGPYGVKARRDDLLAARKVFDTAIIKTSSEDISYSIITSEIGGKKYYTPFKEELAPTDGSLNYYIIPKDGARELTGPEGQIVIKQRAGFYEMHPLSFKDYQNRRFDPEFQPTPPAPTNSPPIITPGQVRVR